MKVVFAPWVSGAEGMEGRGFEFEITAAGLRTFGGEEGDGTAEGPGNGRDGE